jgi:protein-L-isoaspartate(D-aspartate) O-methyltransferase
MVESRRQRKPMDKKLNKARQRMLEEITADAMKTGALTGRHTISERVMSAMAKVPRHLFVSEDDISCAYLNRPRSIGHGQTISQPFIVALMSDFLNLKKGDRVLEIGGGCGYQTAVLAELAGSVFSVEILESLAEEAALRLKNLGYGRIQFRLGDGHDGWPEKAPFDAIMVTAAAARIPATLIEQLKPNGVMIIPVGPTYGPQMLFLGAKNKAGAFIRKATLPVSFVPMVGGGKKKRV